MNNSPINGNGTDQGGLTIFTDPQTGGRCVQFNAGQVIYQPDTAAQNVYYINRGQVRLYLVAGDGSSRLIEILGPGQWLGVAAVAGQATCQARAVAVTDATLTQVGIDQFRAALLRRPEQLLELSRQLAGRLLAANEEAARLVFEDCNQRLLRTLVRFSRSAASAPCEGGVVLRITHDQLAQAIGVARETVSLALTQLRQQNLLKTGRNQLVFNPEALARLAEQTPYRQQSGRREAIQHLA